MRLLREVFLRTSPYLKGTVQITDKVAIAVTEYKTVINASYLCKL